MRNTCLAALLAACTATPALAALQLEGAWVRALPPTQSATAAYLTAVNSGSEALQITAVTASVAGRAEIHTTREVDGMLRMEQLQDVRLAPGEALELKPGGVHLMLLELERMPAEGENVRLCLQADGAEPVCTDAPVRRDGAGAHHHHGHH